MVHLAHILIVDDQPHFRHLVARSLQEDGYHTNIVDNAESAWAYLNRVCPDMVLLHALSEGFDSFDLLLEIKDKAPEFPVLVYAIQSRDAIDRLRESITNVLRESRTVGSRIHSGHARSGGYWIRTIARSKASMVEN